MLSLPSPLRSRIPWPKRGMTRPMSRDKADTLLLLVTCVLVMAPHTAHLPGWIVATGLSLLLWRAWLTLRGNRMPPRWLLLPIAVFAMIAVYANFRTLLGREAGVAMLVLLLTLKVLEMHARRDLFVVLFLGFFLVLTSFFYSQGIGTALMTVIAALAILTTQLSFQYANAVPPLAQRLRLGALILLLAAPLTLVMFILFPRVQGPLWGLPSDAQTARSGMSDTMAPGNISMLALSDDIAFRVRFIDTPPEKSKLYWRGAVLGSYDGRTWSPLQTAELPGAPARDPRRGTPIRYEVTLEPTGRRLLFALDIPQGAPELAGNLVRLLPESQLLSRRPINERVRYEAASYVDYALQPNPARSALAQWLKLPDGYNPRTSEYAARLRASHRTDGGIVNAALKFFRDEKFRYTLEPPALGTHVIDEFLFDTRAGFCEHYSAAFVALMRAAGIPARVVVGYQGGEANPVDGYMTVRQSEAHAWAEVWLEQRGWTRIDPTATVSPDRIETSLAAVLPRSLLGGLITVDLGRSFWLGKLHALRQNWDALTNAWNQQVLNYTPERQQNLMRSLGFTDAGWRTLTALMLAAGAAAMAIVLVPLVRNRRKSDPVEAIYRALCRHMARRGYERAIHEGPRAYASRLTAPESTLPEGKKGAIMRFMMLYESARYGEAGKLPPAAIKSRLKSLLAECR
jgi:transglutaminase-like putative cysteine protease